MFGSMARIPLLDRIFRSSTSAYWNTVPLRRLTTMLLATFCLFGMLGCLIDLMSVGQKPLVIVLTWTLVTGIAAVAMALFATRAPRYIWVPIVLQLVVSKLVEWMIHRYGGSLPHPTIEQGVRTAAVACLVLSMAAFIFFITFIQGEGRLAVRLQTELSLAHAIQKTLVPVIDQRTARAELYGISLPSDQVGGDLVDCVALPDGSTFAYVADISGHGLSAGILMGMVKTAVHTQLFDMPSPQAVFERLNAVLPSVKEEDMYATCTALRIAGGGAGSTCSIDYGIAGQPAILHARAGGGLVSHLADHQLPLGLLQGHNYKGSHIEASPGDVLLIVTDGILETADKSDTEFGMENVASLLREDLTKPLAEIAQTILSAVRAHGKQTDDQTLLLVRILP
jgi:hypothetical protein